MKRSLWLAVSCFAGASALIFISCATFQSAIVAPPEIPGASFVGNTVCFDCHTNITRAFHASAHARIQVVDGTMKGQGGCESCHGAGSLHVKASGGRGKFIFNPGKDSSACFNCHLQTQAEFQLPHHHPVLENKMNCVQCHDPHGTDGMKPARGLAMARLNESCSECHRDQTRPFVFEHEAMREGCTVCHPPHGSVNSKMLVAPDANLCLRCHAQVAGAGVLRGQIFIGKVDHTTLLRRGTCWSAGCHTAIHGSNMHPLMLY